MIQSLRSGSALAALALFAIPAFAQSPAGSPDRDHGDGVQLMLRYGTFDPLQGQPGVPNVLRAANSRLWVAQSNGRPTAAFRQAITDTGAKLCGYLPHNSYVVRTSAANSETIAQSPLVRWVGSYQPAWRLEPELVDAIKANRELPTARYHIVVVDKHIDKPKLARDILAMGGIIDNEQPGSLLFTVTLTNDQLIKAAHLDEVLWIDRWTAPENDVDNARIQGGANYVETQRGYTGQGLNAHIYEGIDAAHQAYSGPVTNVLSGGASTGHGTNTAGIVFGDGTGNSAFRGFAPDVGKFYTNYSSVTTSRWAVVDDLVNNRDVSHTTASWGDARTFFYTSVSADADDIVFDHDICWTQSQSNAGNQDSRPQAWAKNVFSIGGVRHGNNSNPLDDTWSSSGSTGPASDGRIKPTLAAYYDNIGTTSPGGGYTTTFGGTSGATPIIAGLNVLAIDMFTDEVVPGFGPFGQALRNPGGSKHSNRPHFTTLKALQVASSRQYTFNAASTDNRREHVGYGFPDLQLMWDNRAKTFIVDETDVLAQGTNSRWDITVGASEPELRVVMHHAEPAGNPAATLHRVNDLSIRVTAPNGTIYWGNNGIEQGNWSTPGGTADSINPLECVIIQNPQAGIWHVDVIATLVVQDSHVETPAVDADYGLVVSGGTGQGGQAPVLASLTNYGAGCSAPATPSVPQTFYELFGGSIDLANSAIRFTPNGTGGWDVSTAGASFFNGYSNNLGLADDQLSRNHSLGFAFPLPGGGSTTAIDIDSNGWVGLVANAHSVSDYTESVSEFLAEPRRIAVCWDDLNPSSSGGVYFDTVPGQAVATWAGVPEYQSVGSNTLQLQLFPNGEFVLAYQSLSLGDALVGHSLGAGVPDPGPSDLTNPSNVSLLTHAASGPPVFGSTVTLTTSNYPVGSAVGAHVLSLIKHDPGISLANQGMPGCHQYVGLDSVLVAFPVGNQTQTNFAIPTDPAFLSLAISGQGYAFAPGANAAGVLSSNGVTMTIGN
ncbi:MAG: S8 family serine peptidase [bacterium]|nr:S8 family serine peptidase [bacterium]